MIISFAKLRNKGWTNINYERKRGQLRKSGPGFSRDLPRKSTDCEAGATNATTN